MELFPPEFVLAGQVARDRTKKRVFAREGRAVRKLLLDGARLDANYDYDYDALAG